MQEFPYFSPIYKTNKVFICGKVLSRPVFSHELYNKNFFEFIVGVYRLSGQCDEIPITVEENHLYYKNIKIGKTVAIGGQFRSFNKIIDNRSRLFLTVYVNDFFDTADTPENANTIELEGYICKKPQFRTTPKNREICDLIVAVNRPIFTKSDYIPCIVWGANARFCTNLKVGSKVNLIGRIQSRQYVKKLSESDMEIRTAYEVSISKITCLDTAF